MWIIRRVLFYYNMFSILIMPVSSHLPEYASTPANRVDLYCVLSETCVHDTIPICGKMDNEKRTFLDICDLLEYACDTGHVYVHTEDLPDCPLISGK